MTPYPTSQMHAAQKRGMYPMGGHHHQMPPAQNVPNSGVMYPHNQQNYGPVPPMHQNYMRSGPMSNYGRNAGANGAGNAAAQSAMMSQQQRPIGPQYNMTQSNAGPAVTGGNVNAANNMMNAAGHQSQYNYNHVGPNASGMNQTGYQNVQG